MKHLFGVIALMLFLILLLNCNINPMGPQLNELKNSNNYFPVQKYSKYLYETNNHDTMIITISKENFQYNGENVYLVQEGTLNDTLNYDIISNSKGVYFYLLGDTKPFLKYPLIKDFSWSYDYFTMIYVFSVIDYDYSLENYDDVKEIEWDYYFNKVTPQFDKTEYYYFVNGIGPVKIVKDNKKYILKEYK